MSKSKQYPPLVEKTILFLVNNKVKFEIIEHKEIDGTQSEDLVKALNVPLNHIIKVLLWKLRGGKFVLTVLSGDQRLDKSILKQYLQKKVDRLANKDELIKITGYEAGGIPPILLISDVPCFVDEHLMELEWVIGSAGSPYYGLKLDPVDIRRLMNAKVVNLRLNSF
ncbi:MAG: aminoacyl-tRNA deacylase [Promethearchaeota archaeon]